MRDPAVIPAKAGIQCLHPTTLDPRLRGDDVVVFRRDQLI